MWKKHRVDTKLDCFFLERKEKEILIFVLKGSFFNFKKIEPLNLRKNPRANFDEKSILPSHDYASPSVHPLDGEFAGFRWAFATGQSLERNSRDSRARESSSG